MEFSRDPQLEYELSERLRMKYTQPRPDLHLSDLIGCLTASYFDKWEPVQHDDKAIMFFAIGFGLEEVILRDDDTPPPEVVEEDGIHMTMDYISTLGGQPVDLKSTRMRFKDDGTPAKHGWPEHWMKQFKAYAYARQDTRFSVAVIQLIGAELIAGTFNFTWEELEENWYYILGRRDIWRTAQHTGVPPTPFKFNHGASKNSFECKNRTSTCRYWLRCGKIDRELQGKE